MGAEEDISDEKLEKLASVEPKQVVIDIEVAGDDGVPDADRAEYPVSTIVGWDSHSDEYVGWILTSDEHTGQQVEHLRQRETEAEAGVDALRVFGDESSMLHDFNEWLRDQQPDIITGWFSNDFDLPYLVNRCRNLNTYNYQEWSPIGEVFISKYEPVVKGIECVDMLGAYKKTQIHKLKQKGLDDIAKKELGESKEEIEMGHTEMWKKKPVEFLRYNKVDVELVHEIDEEAGAIDLLDNLRGVVGCSYTDPIGGNIDMMDMLFLRKAKEYGFALPTAKEPDVGDYHGAYVYTPVAGLHSDVVYPDYSSLYPNMMYQCNISPETLVGTKADLAASEYTEDDCVWTYIDTATPPPLKEGVEANEEKMEKLYFLDPSIEEGFIRSVLDDVMGLADQYTGGMYEAVKRVRNSTYGVMGDSDSYGRGFRLFDWRLAEGTTLGGQRVLKDGAEYFLDSVNEHAGTEEPAATIVGGDSVPANEPTLIRREGEVQIVSIEDVTTDDEVWTDAGWRGVKNVIQKPNSKQLYTVWTKHGITHVTEDHGLIRDSGEEVKPTEAEEGDELLHRDVADVDVSGMSMKEERAWLLGLFAAEGSCGIYECESGSKASWAINNQDRELLEHAQEILSETFGVQTKVDDVMESSNTMKLRLDKVGDNASVVLGFREMLYDGTEKRVPKEILNGTEDVQRAFVAGHHAGDGHIAHDHKEFDELWTKHKHLAAGLAFLLRQLGHTVSMHVRTEQTDEFYRIRSVAFTVGNDDEIIGIEEYDYSGSYVYDLETENHHFQSGVGSMIVHNTDSFMTAIEFAEDGEEALQVAEDATEETNSWLDSYAAETFGLDSEDDARMELEVESYASALFFKGDDEGCSDEGVKKRYAQVIEWSDDDDGWLDEPDIGIKGFEYVRSDVAAVTADVQYFTFEKLLTMDEAEAEEAVKKYVTRVITEIVEGEYDDADLAIPFGISQSLQQYGQNGRGMPWYHGAKYANEYIYGGEAIQSGGDPVYFYIEEGKTGEGRPSTFRADDAAKGDYVNCIAVTDADDVPEDMRIDRPKMVQKAVIDPMEAIFRTLDWGTEWMYDAMENATPPSYHRDENQLGFEDVM